MQITRTTRIGLLTLLLLALALSTAAAPNIWVKLGQRTVSDRVDHDVIKVGAGKGRFSDLQLRATDSKVRVRNVVVVFGDGSRQEFKKNFTLHRGERTGAINLDGGRRVVREVRFVYDESSILRRTAEVHLWGRR
ncbi:MAG: DUF2541 family protein [Thermoanaerobaculia bacterium]|nr:DUF2541 family protein [Thermoanaerobaculia bacterium]